MSPNPIIPPQSSSAAAAAASFVFPREYHFPPFFTRQPNQSTRHSQHAKWASLILAYCAHHGLYKLSLSSPAAEDLFHNRRIGRRLALADAREVLEFMRRDGRAEFVVGGGSGGADDGISNGGGGEAGDVVWVYWRTPEEWATLIETWVDETAQKGTVLTLYELSQGEDTLGTEFHGLDLELLQKALQVLVKRNKAQIFGQEDQLGVKFF
ncbi:ESCRT-II complex, vps25 subunit [Nemania serpens]|nr:ESCRT-II complex, vps25 subunit [Nemania serpens]